MFKTFIKYSSVLFSGLVGFIMLALIYTQPPALASSRVMYDDPTPTTTYANASLTLALPSGGTPTGHAGAQIQLTGSGFPANSPIILYAATDPAQCVPGQSGAAAIQPSSGGSTTDANGGFQIVAAWPSSGATQPNTAYYVCANVSNTTKASNTTFTVLPPPSAVASPQTINAGDAVTISGQYWNPQETLMVSISAGQGSSAIANQQVMADANGTFTTSLTVPAGAPGGNYGINITDATNAALTQYFANAITINQQATPTAQATATETPTPTSPAATVTATPTPSGSDDGGSSDGGSILWLIFGLGGLGVILVIIGLTMFLTNSHSS